MKKGYFHPCKKHFQQNWWMEDMPVVAGRLVLINHLNMNFYKFPLVKTSQIVNLTVVKWKITIITFWKMKTFSFCLTFYPLFLTGKMCIRNRLLLTLSILYKTCIFRRSQSVQSSSVNDQKVSVFGRYLIILSLFTVRISWTWGREMA